MIDVGGPALLRAAAKNFASVTVIVRARDYDAVLDELRAGGGTTTPELRRRLAAIAFARSAAYEASIARWFQRDSELPGDVRAGVRPRARAAVRREPAPAGGLLRGARRPHAPARVRPAASGQGAFVQQPRRPLRSAAARCGARRAGLRDREAREPVRRRRRRLHREGVCEGARGGSRVGIRGCRRGQPSRDGGARRDAGRRSSSRSCSLRRTTRLRWISSPESRHSASSSTPTSARSTKRSVTIAGSSAVSSFRIATGLLVDRDAHAGRMRGRVRRAVGRPPVRVARRQARHVERDRARARGPDARSRRRADEPRRRGADRDREGARARPLPRRRRPRVGRVLPVRGRASAGARRGDRGDHPARRLEARRAR